jgi:hypothetical protein
VEGGEERELVGGVRLYIYWVRNRPTPSDLAGRYGVGRLIEVIGGRHVGPWVACGSGREAAACLPHFSFSLTFIIRSEITGIMLRQHAASATGNNSTYLLRAQQESCKDL